MLLHEIRVPVPEQREGQPREKTVGNDDERFARREPLRDGTENEIEELAGGELEHLGRKRGNDPRPGRRRARALMRDLPQEPEEGRDPRLDRRARRQHEDLEGGPRCREEERSPFAEKIGENALSGRERREELVGLLHPRVERVGVRPAAVLELEAQLREAPLDRLDPLENVGPFFGIESAALQARLVEGEPREDVPFFGEQPFRPALARAAHRLPEKRGEGLRAASLGVAQRLPRVGRASGPKEEQIHDTLVRLDRGLEQVATQLLGAGETAERLDRDDGPVLIGIRLRRVPRRER